MWQWYVGKGWVEVDWENIIFMKQEQYSLSKLSGNRRATQTTNSAEYVLDGSKEQGDLWNDLEIGQRLLIEMNLINMLF